MIVAKFGGTSMANANQIKKVAELTKGDQYTIVVVSAPGKRTPDDTKMTDLLYKFADDKTLYKPIYDRLVEIEDELKISHSSSKHFMENKDSYNTKDIIASRGEYYSARIFAEYTNRIFLDTKELITINGEGKAEESSYDVIKKAIDSNKRYAVPGFYGSDTSGNIKTFSRGGSDITGSIFARAINAKVYENWTDVDGVMTADPRKDPNAKKIDKMTYAELLKMAENGAQVFHPFAIEPVINIIPINIRNTNNPSSSGTWIE